MCSSYWSIEKAILTCPFCKATSAWEELQTHFYGGDEGGMCWDHYKLGRPALPLRGIQQMILDGDTDGFIGQCPKCHAYVDIGAEIRNGAVVRMFTVEPTPPRSNSKQYASTKS